jgi:hypothetical protein
MYSNSHNMTKKKYNLVVISSQDDYKKEVICDNMDVGNGYYYFYNIPEKENGWREVISYYPIARTFIESVKEFEVEEEESGSDGIIKVSPGETMFGSL